MLASAVFAWALASCPAHYGRFAEATIHFQEGSTELTEEARRQIARIVEPVAGDPLAEVQISAYFPYGARQPSNSAVALAAARIRAIETFASGFGVSPDLIGGRESAIGRTMEDDGGTARAPYPSERLQIVDIEVKVKTDCHPLTDLARRTSPYR